MSVTVEFEGSDIYITEGSRVHRVYPARHGAGTYWVDWDRGPSRGGIETGVLTVDDFGNMINSFSGARQRAMYRQDLH
jgi:hypothetical protein